MTKNLIADYDADEIPSGTGNAKALTVPSGVENSLIIKLLVDTRVKDLAGKPSRFYSYNTHSHSAEIKGKLMTLPHPCGKVMFDECPECDKYYSVLEKTRKMDKFVVDQQFNGKWPKRKELDEIVMQDPEYRKLAKLRDTFKPSKRAIFLVNRLGSDKIEALAVSQGVVNEIFGAAAYQDKPATEGIYTELKREGYNIFNLKQPSEAQVAQGSKAGGWLKLWSTGSVGGGNYKMHIEHYKVKTKVIHNGKTMEVDAVCEDEVNPAIFKLTTDHLPDIRSIANSYGWTLDQIQSYVDSDGKTLPKFGKKEKTDSSVATKAVYTKPPVDDDEDFSTFSDSDSNDTSFNQEFDDSINF